MKRRQRGEKRSKSYAPDRAAVLNAAIEELERKIERSYWRKECEELECKIQDLNRELQNLER